MHIVKKTCELAEQTIHDVNAGVVLSVAAMANGEFKLVIHSDCVPGGERTYVFGTGGRLKETWSPYTRPNLERIA